MKVNRVCQSCGAVTPLDTASFRCACGGLYRLSYPKGRIDFAATAVSRDRSLYKYAAALPFDARKKPWSQAAMGEGGTPLLELHKSVYCKADYLMPTLSFKDRGASVLMTAARELGVKEAVADSSGNAGTAIAAYGARAGIACHIFASAATSKKKLEQIEAHGALLHLTEGSREDVARAAIAYVRAHGLFYASHIFNPLFYEGTKTYAYEVFEQLSFRMPDIFLLPAGNGTLVLGVYLALTELKSWGYICELPRIFAVQAEGCAPIARAFERGEAEVREVENTGTAAEGIAIAAPARGAEILKAVRETKGSVLAVTDAEILHARAALGLRGLYVETTSAASYAAYLRMEKDGGAEGRLIVLPLCGAGLKG
ncbi:MAG: threonine synthase [Clostridiaceae bacterium]|nr:threonine synthase [Eubacteriales bacterium]